MKVIVLNGSPNSAGNTAAALDVVCGALGNSGIESERIEVGRAVLHSCTACRACHNRKNRLCVHMGDLVNEVLEKLYAAEGLLVGSPVHFGGISGALKSFLDRAFFVATANNHLFRHKVGAGVVAVRRGGEMAALDQIHNYFTTSEMFVPSGNYWGLVFGRFPGEAALDDEGMQCMEILGENMAWLLHAVADGKAKLPPFREKVFTNFIR